MTDLIKPYQLSLHHMLNVQIRYTDLPHLTGRVRLIRFPNAPDSPSAFFGGMGERDEFWENPNEHLPEAIRQEVEELFKDDDIPLYLDSSEMVFDNSGEVAEFPAALVDDESGVWKWHEAILKAQYR